MTITEERISDVLIVNLTGRMETSAAISLEQKVNQLIDSGERKIILYMGQVNYMSSSGLRALLGLAKRLENEGGALVLSCLSEQVRELTVLAQLDQIIPVYHSNGEAAVALSRM